MRYGPTPEIQMSFLRLVLLQFVSGLNSWFSTRDTMTMMMFLHHSSYTGLSYTV